MTQPPISLRSIRRFLACSALLLACALAGLTSWPGRPLAQEAENQSPGFGLFYSEGSSQSGQPVRRAGYITRRLKDGATEGTLALVVENQPDWLDYSLLDTGLTAGQVKLDYSSVYVEVKRYFPLASWFRYYWGIRGGYTRVEGTTGQGAAQQEVRKEQIAPLALLAIPFMLENPAFGLAAFADGASMGVAVDVIEGRVWLDGQVAATLQPQFRTAQLAADERFFLTRSLSLTMAF